MRTQEAASSDGGGEGAGGIGEGEGEGVGSLHDGPPTAQASSSSWPHPGCGDASSRSTRTSKPLALRFVAEMLKLFPQQGPGLVCLPMWMLPVIAMRTSNGGAGSLGENGTCCLHTLPS